MPPVPATGGARLKSGGMISGALRATANSSGVFALLEAQPVAAAAATNVTAKKTLRILWPLLGIAPCFMILTAHEGTQQQDHDGNANRRIADIEYQKGPPRAKLQVGEIDDIAVQRPVADVAEPAAAHHTKRGLVEPLRLPPHPHRNADRDCTGQCDQHPAAGLGRGV